VLRDWFKNHSLHVLNLTNSDGMKVDYVNLAKMYLLLADTSTTRLSREKSTNEQWLVPSCYRALAVSKSAQRPIMSEERGNTRHVSDKRVPFCAFLKFPVTRRALEMPQLQVARRPAIQSISKTQDTEPFCMAVAQAVPWQTAGQVAWFACRPARVGRPPGGWLTGGSPNNRWRSEGVAGWLERLVQRLTCCAVRSLCGCKQAI